jgi:hypothetical protein
MQAPTDNDYARKDMQRIGAPVMARMEGELGIPRYPREFQESRIAKLFQCSLGGLLLCPLA